MRYNYIYIYVMIYVICRDISWYVYSWFTNYLRGTQNCQKKTLIVCTSWTTEKNDRETSGVLIPPHHSLTCLWLNHAQSISCSIYTQKTNTIACEICMRSVAFSGYWWIYGPIMDDDPPKVGPVAVHGSWTFHHKPGKKHLEDDFA